MKFTPLTETLYRYVVDHTRVPHPILTQLAEETKSNPLAGMQISPDQGALMHLMAKSIGARLCLEIGCFTGYSAICLASALPSDGKLVTLDINKENTDVALRYFQSAKLSDRIELRLAPAMETLPKLLDQYGEGSFDMAFIDADKENQWNYFQYAMKLLRPGGLILVDNVLWGARVVDPRDGSPATVAIRAFNDKLKDDDRVDYALTYLSDGLSLIRKK